jgi:hypothetical protein
MRTTLVWAIMQQVVVISYGRFVTKYLSNHQGSRIQKGNGFFTLEDGNDRLSRRVSKELPLLAA